MATWLIYGTVKYGKTHRRDDETGLALCSFRGQFQVTGNLGETSCQHCLRKMKKDGIRW